MTDGESSADHHIPPLSHRNPCHHRHLCHLCHHHHIVTCVTTVTCEGGRREGEREGGRVGEKNGGRDRNGLFFVASTHVLVDYNVAV